MLFEEALAESKVSTIYIDPYKHHGFSTLTEFIIAKLKRRLEAILAGDTRRYSTKVEVERRLNPNMDVYDYKGNPARYTSFNVLVSADSKKLLSQSICQYDSGRNDFKITLGIKFAVFSRELVTKADTQADRKFSDAQTDNIIATLAHEVTHVAQRLNKAMDHRAAFVRKQTKELTGRKNPSTRMQQKTYWNIHDTVPTEWDARVAELCEYLKMGKIRPAVFMAQEEHKYFYKNIDFKKFISKATNYGVTASVLREFMKELREQCYEWPIRRIEGYTGDYEDVTKSAKLIEGNLSDIVAKAIQYRGILRMADRSSLKLLEYFLSRFQIGKEYIISSIKVCCPDIDAEAKYKEFLEIITDGIDYVKDAERRYS